MCDKNIIDKLTNEINILRQENEMLKLSLKEYKEAESTSVVNDRGLVSRNNQTIKPLQQGEEKIKQMLYNISDALFIVRIEKDGVQGKFLEVNDIACDKLGYSYEEMLNMSPHDLSINDPEEIYKIGVEIYKNKRVIFETSIRSKGGKYFPVEINASLIDWFEEKCILAVARDISRRKEAERDLKESLENQEKVMAFLPDAVFIVKKNKIVYANEHGINLLGYNSLREIVGGKYFDIIHPDYHKSEKDRLRFVARENKPAPLIEQKYLKKNGDIVDTEVTAIKIPYKNNFAFLLAARDVSSRKQIKKLKEDIETTREFNRVLTEFFSNISHELKTPLNVILGAIQMLGLSGQIESLGEFDTKLNKYLKVMKQNCFRLLRLVNNLIDLSKLDSGYMKANLRNNNIVNIIEDITLSVADYIEDRGMELIFDTDIEEKIMAFDADKVERIILNLLSNSIKFSKPGDKIMVSIFDKNESIIISVRDTGVGIPEDKLTLIFDRFGQVDKTLARNREGSGIGLALVKSLVDMHGGNIKVNSIYGEGSEFVIEIPCKIVEVEEAHETFQYQSNVERISIEFSDIYG
jgi:PAS domain S-box-containing protein